MHIVLVNRWYPPHTGWGGVAAYDYNLGHALAALGHTVTVVAARLSGATPAFEQDGPVRVHRILGREHYYLGRLPLLGRYARPYLQFQYSRQVARFLGQLEKQDMPDIVEFAEINAEGYAYLRQKRRLPVVVRCHTPTFILQRYYTPSEMPFDTRLTGRMEKACIHRADALSAPSLDMATTIGGTCGIDPARFRMIPNALDLAPFSNPARNTQPLGEPPAVTILHVGRLERVKGVEVLARAIPMVVRQLPQARFVFIGEDRPDGQGSTWKKRLALFFQEQGAAANVEVLGSIPQEELLAWYRRADLAVVPSLLYESFSYTCAQAMAAGLPVVASRIGGIPETVGDCGLIVESGDVGGLAEAISRLASDPQERLRLGRQAQERARLTFSASLAAESTLDFYQSLLESKS
jgi:glycosyltransferase involved in cell wall biosynthesis